jgi:hypothetical protein
VRVDRRKMMTAFGCNLVIAVSALFSVNLLPVPRGEADLSVFLMVTLGGWIPKDGGLFGFFLHGLLLSIPFLINLLLFSQVFTEDWDCVSTYVFTRNGSRTRWYRNKCVELFLYLFASYAFQLAASFFIGLFAFGFSIGQLNHLLCTMAYLFSLGFGVQLLYLLAANIMSLLAGHALAPLFLWVFHMPLFLLLYASLPEKLLRFWPSAQFIFSLHDIPSLRDITLQSIESAGGMSWAYSFLYLVLGVTVTAVIGLKRLNKGDLLAK